jgi:hypothetical protein
MPKRNKCLYLCFDQKEIEDSWSHENFLKRENMPMSTIDIINYSNEYESDLFKIYQSIINEKVYLLTDPAEFHMSEADFGKWME